MKNKLQWEKSEIPIFLLNLPIFITLTGNEVLQHAGTISHQQALSKAEHEYEKFKELNKNELSNIEKDFIKQIETTAIKLNLKKKMNDE